MDTGNLGWVRSSVPPCRIRSLLKEFQGRGGGGGGRGLDRSRPPRILNETGASWGILKEDLPIATGGLCPRAARCGSGWR